MSKFGLASVFALFLVFPLEAFPQVYRWVDEHGNVHYSDKKPPESDAKTVDQVEMSEVENTVDSGADNRSAAQMRVNRLQREKERAEKNEKRLAEGAIKFQEKNCYIATEYERKGKVGGGTRIVSTKEVKRCRTPIPDSLKPYMGDYEYDGREEK